MERISCQSFDSRGNEDGIVMMNYGLSFTKEWLGQEGLQMVI
jgi:hypothetical protein